MERGDIYIEQSQVINLNNDVEDRPAQIYDNRDVSQINEGRLQHDLIARNHFNYYSVAFKNVIGNFSFISQI